MSQAAYRIKFDEYLDNKYEMISLNGLAYPVSRVLSRIDPILYTEMFDSWYAVARFTIRNAHVYVCHDCQKVMNNGCFKMHSEELCYNCLIKL